MSWKVLTVLCALGMSCAMSRATPAPPVLEYGPTNQYGSKIQRSMRLMAESQPSARKTVKVFFYGQSITEQIWSQWIEDELRIRFPNCNLVVSNLAIRGFSSEFLVRSAEADLYSFYPDLLIFHVYGSYFPYEQIVSGLRRRTTADILIQTDHIVLDSELSERTDAILGNLSPEAWRNYVFLPNLAKTYGAELADVRTLWKRYLRDHELPAGSLLWDSIHLNGNGNLLMKELVSSYLRVDESFPDDSWQEAVKTYAVGKDVAWQGNELHLDFIGNRVDLLFSTSSDAAIEVLIDGQSPSAFPELYGFTRTDLYPNTAWPAIMRISSEKPLLEEKWTARVTEYLTNGHPHIRFSVHGSKTGFDGEGISTNLFVSQSGRVVIHPFDWLMIRWGATVQPLAVGHEIQWESKGYFLDKAVPAVGDASVENFATVAQGLSNGRHKLTLRGESSALSAVRVYNPLARTQPAASAHGFRIERLQREGLTLSMSVSASGRYVVEAVSDWTGEWKPLTAAITTPNVRVPLSADRQFIRLRQID